MRYYVATVLQHDGSLRKQLIGDYTDGRGNVCLDYCPPGTKSVTVYLKFQQAAQALGITDAELLAQHAELEMAEEELYAPAVEEDRDRIRDQLYELERAICRAVDRGDPLAEAVIATNVETLLANLTRHFEGDGNENGKDPL